MAHELDMSTGKTAFALRSGSRPAWHGYGNHPENDSLEAFGKAAGFEWSAMRRPLFDQDDKGNFVRIDGQYSLRRSDTGIVLGIHSDNYYAVQPIDILNFFRDFVLASDDFEMETAGCLKNGKVIWGLARYKKDLSIVGDLHVPYVFLTTSFDGSLATTAQATMTRVVCNNTLTQSIYDRRAANVRIPHNQQFDTIAQDRAAASLAEVAASFDRYRNMAEALVNVRMGRDAAKKLFETLMTEPVLDPVTKKLTPRGETMRANTMGKFFAMLDKTVQEGAPKDTAWTVLNAVTDYVDHEKRVVGGISGRMYSSFVGGAGFDMKSKAFNSLVKIAENASTKGLALAA